MSPQQAAQSLKKYSHSKIRSLKPTGMNCTEWLCMMANPLRAVIITV
jgi:hypothetical protein